MRLKQHLRGRAWAVAAALVPLFAIAMVAQGAANKPLTAYQQQLRSQVQTTTGAPITGRDPAKQMQISLQTAGSMPEGIGTRVDKDAAAVVGDHNHHVNPALVLPNPKTSGIYSNGCKVGFAKPGQTCVTAFMPDTSVIDCATSQTACSPALTPKGTGPAQPKKP
jgi:hypothetical protein